jgi:hypothetical protein
MILYHTGFETIREPDVHYGRKNADFGQGFYLTADVDFAHRWAREKKGVQTVINTYKFNIEGLKIRRFSRDAEWFRYIFGNRSGKPDELTEDVIIGPIANDTIYDTFGIITSGLLKPEDAMRLLMIGSEYHQIALKTRQAASALTWLSSEAILSESVAGYREIVAAEEKEYQELFARELNQIMDSYGQQS